MGRGGAAAAGTALLPPALARIDRSAARRFARYAAVGLASVVVSTTLFLLFRSWWAAVPANLAALTLTAVASTEANRRFTFDGARAVRSRVYLQNAGTVAFYACYGSAVLVLLGDVVDAPTALEEGGAVAAASLLGGVLRFLVLRHWVFGAPRDGSGTVGA